MSANSHGRAAAAAALTAMALGVGGCGGSTGGPAHAASRPTQLYTVALSGRAERRPAAPRARGFAVIAFHGPTTVCWRFAHLHGFTNATRAAIYAGPTGESGGLVIALTGPPRLHHRGCVATTAATGAKVTSAPSSFYVNVFAAGSPLGAVRGQL